MKKKYQVFLSSTYKDLQHERMLAIEEILKADCIPVGMELFPASHDDPLKYIRRIIDESDYYLLIVAGKYGSEFEGVSFTEHEFNYAVSQNKKIVAFVHKSLEQLPLAKVDTGASFKKLDIFRKKLNKLKIARDWTNPDQLSERILHAIINLKTDYPAEGWIKANRENLRELTFDSERGLKKKIEQLKKKILALESESRILPSKQYKGENENLGIIVRRRLDIIDKEAKQIFGSSIISSKTAHQIEFSSQKIVDSLSLLGIPLDICCEIVEKSIAELKLIKQKHHQLSTSDIRRAVSEALYRLEPATANPKRIQYWADSYIRKYGNPTRNITVVDDSGQFGGELFPLSYALLKKHVLRDTLKKIFGENEEKYFKQMSFNERELFSEEVMRQVKFLDIYRIHYSALVVIAKELALSPPHPWFADPPRIEDAVRYDLERAGHHAGKLHTMLRTSNIQEGFYSINECIHHSCSGLLASYGVFLGCGYMSPFYNLLHHFSEFRKGRKTDAHSYSDISELFVDLEASNVNIEQMTQDMDMYKFSVKGQPGIQPETAPDVAAFAISLFDVFQLNTRKKFPGMC